MLSAVVLFVLTTLHSADAQQKRGPSNPRVLFVGNSYTFRNNLPDLIKNLAKSGKTKHSIEVEMIATGGATLEEHWRNGRAVEAIHRGGWDYVVLQEQSQLGGGLIDGKPFMNDPDGFYTFARLFDKEIKAVGARTVLMHTWARLGYESQQAALDEAYAHVVRELDPLLVPVGFMWPRIRKARPDLNLYGNDGAHPSPLGTYAAACLFYAMLFDESPIGLGTRISGRVIDSQSREPAHFTEKVAMIAGIPASDAKFVQNAAWAVHNDLKSGIGGALLKPR
jgi:hypothetical protein